MLAAKLLVVCVNNMWLIVKLSVAAACQPMDIYVSCHVCALFDW